MTEGVIGSEVGGYRIEELLGRGGMGVVYRATEERLGRSVAIKVIAPEHASNPSFRDRFLAESRAAAAIDHPNVLPIYGAGEEDGALYLVVRLVEGSDLKDLLATGGALEPRRALGVVAQVAAALDAAHARGLIHRDVKPANVLVTGDAGAGTEHCYLTDFGLAKQIDDQSGLTATGQFVGTLDYIAPEQIQGAPADSRVDVYALGALFHQCLTGSPPFKRDTEAAVLYAHLSEPPPTVSDHVAGVPEAVDPALARAMAKAPEDRFPTCAEFVAELGAAFDDRQPAAPAATAPAPIAPAPPTRLAPVQAPGTAGRRRWPIAVAAVTAILLVAGIGWAVLGSGGGEGESGGGSTVALELTTDSVALAGQVGSETARLAERVGADGDTGSLAAGFERSEAKASDLGARAQDDLASGDPGRDDLNRSSRDLAGASATLAELAQDSGSDGADELAAGARRRMTGALAALERSLAELERAFSDEGATDAATAVGTSLDQLRTRQSRLTTPFDNLVESLQGG